MHTLRVETHFRARKIRVELCVIPKNRLWRSHSSRPTHGQVILNVEELSSAAMVLIRSFINL